MAPIEARIRDQMKEKEMFQFKRDIEDKFSGQNPIKKHEIREDSVEDYAETIKQLGEIDSHFIAGGHLESEAIETRNGQADEFPVMLNMMMH